ncbi:PPC domain-containing DNA-binding protein [Mucilaginibacter aquaedulcis]|uniref:PPC domain-containing DNA-binding protein n=1 Tax=Mucilaginibacter aquaedulcis TaxID=1187081 RepID=UPI0025B48D08|nr:PPC domain-containing DNA-binding protein [Mucilaginibacter aquaedulcis]MDN3549627.1 DNA-binding protein [Mucilaginibacter aquaedulcis]
MKNLFTKNAFGTIILFAAIWVFTAQYAAAQEYVSPVKPIETGRSPGVKSKLINSAPKTYILVFAKGDEILSGITEFAQKNNIKTAHFTAIGDATAAKVGWYDKERKMFKVITINEQSEITSMVGDIAWLNNSKPSVHAHINLADSSGLVHGGHLLEAFVSPTLEVVLTVDPIAMHKGFNEESGINLIDPNKP